MKIISWNVNGIRAVLKKGFLDFLKKEKPDVLCVQEIKIAEAARIKELDHILNLKETGYNIFWNSAERPGYSGTATLIKKNKNNKTKSYNNLFNIKEFDIEGRMQTIEFEKFYLINLYFPNANHELSRLQYKLDFNNALLKMAKKLEKKKPVIICGDYNVAHEEIDLTNPKNNIGNPGFTHEEREWMSKFLSKGFVDTFRYFYPEKQKYTWWSYRFNARVRNIGWRIDYFCTSKSIIKKIKKAYILNEIIGSDHCPVGIEIYQC